MFSDKYFRRVEAYWENALSIAINTCNYNVFVVLLWLGIGVFFNSIYQATIYKIPQQRKSKPHLYSPHRNCVVASDAALML